jgi:hypothetical protein
MKIRPVRAAIFLADGRTDINDEAKSRFSQKGLIAESRKVVSIQLHHQVQRGSAQYVCFAVHFESRPNGCDNKFSQITLLNFS